jgi:hypothetical protein
MVANSATPSFATRAIYTPQRIPQYRGNPYIEALPPPLDEDGLLESLFSVPPFDAGQRDWSKAERLQLISQLASFMVPLERHLQLAQHLDAMMRQGYVGRAPRTVESQRVFAKLYEQQKAGKTFDMSAVQHTLQLSGALIGIPGMGKTTSIKRVLARIPEVIFHPAYNIYQVPYLHIETPYDGASVKGLAESIFRKMDMVLPDAHYGKQYGNQRAGAETLMNHAARVLHMHAVGLLVVDELQNLENAPRNHEALMTLLVSASNELGVPILFVGTNKAERLLCQDFRQARRSSGIVSSYWGPLRQGSSEAPDEWEDFMSVLWRFQWVREAVPLTLQLSDLMFRHSQGVTDIAIKLFALAQARAIHDGTESLTAVLIDNVAHQEMAWVMPMIEAIRRDDIRALAAYRDISPLGLESLLNGVGSKFAGRQVRGAVIGGDNPLFAPTVTEALTTVGFEPTDAQALAAQVANAPSVLDGVRQALRQATSGKPVKSEKNQLKSLPVTYPPGDYRNALVPDSQGGSVTERMRALNMLADLDVLLPG